MSNAAEVNQQVAARRHEWAERLRCDYAFPYNTHSERENIEREFIHWSRERAEYARAAMKEMGVTDEDQYYA